jgi:hypothetical protein
VDNRSEVREFLTSRRAKVTPEQSALPIFGGNRRVTGLRREPRILDAMTGAPAYVRNGRRDVLAANLLGRALYSPMYADPARPVNIARFPACARWRASPAP